MKKLLFLFILGGCAAGVTAQNLIPNPGFDQKTACPSAIGQIGYVADWNSYTQHNADYYNSCNTAPNNYSIPANVWGSEAQQSAAANQAYVGMYTLFPGQTPNRKTYLHCQIPALQQGQTYAMSVNVSLGDLSAVAADGLGVHFFVAGSSFVNNGNPIYLTPKVSYDSYGVITNATGWTKLTKLFIADSAYTHMVIGVFKNDTVQNAVTVMPGQSDRPAYYYIDDVELELIPASVNEQMLMNNIKLYPNPTTGSLNITMPQMKNGDAQLTVYSMMGQKLFDTTLTPQNQSIQLPASMNNGTYLAAIKTEAGVKTIPFTLQR